jgi:hypothetical protein
VAMLGSGNIYFGSEDKQAAALKMETVCFSEKLVSVYESTRHQTHKNIIIQIVSLSKLRIDQTRIFCSLAMPRRHREC